MRIMCNASEDGLGAVLQQQTAEGERLEGYSFRITVFGLLEQNCSIKELELIAVFCANKDFKTNFIQYTD